MTNSLWPKQTQNKTVFFSKAPCRDPWQHLRQRRWGPKTANIVSHMNGPTYAMTIIQHKPGKKRICWKKRNNYVVETDQMKSHV